MKLFYYTCAFLLMPILVFSQNQLTKDYIEKYKRIAISEMKRTQIPASIILAQGILESSSGESILAAKYNNHFGIKCKNDWKGATTYRDDDKKNECFRVYPTADSSYIDHSNFLKTRPNYAPLFELDPVDDTAWAYGLKKAGYATERDYPLRLLKIIDDYELAQYNYPELDNEPNDSIPTKDTLKENLIKPITPIVIKNTISPNTDTTSLNNIKGIQSDSVILAPIGELQRIGTIATDTIQKIKTDTLPANTALKMKSDTTHILKADTIATNKNTIKVDTVAVIKEVAKAEIKKDTVVAKKTNNYPLNQKFKINQVPAIWAEKGRSFLDIANTYSVPLFKIYKYNNLPETELVENDQIIYLAEQKKDANPSTTPSNSPGNNNITPINNTKSPINIIKSSIKSILDIPLLKKKKTN